MISLLGLALLLQQGTFLGNSSPPSGDTVGYWQQQVRYSIVATLDEERMAARATGEMVYINHSPDTLREMFVHQYLNAFRPGSKWSASDARENRVRFQNLADPNYGYERFTAAPVVNGTPVLVTYPHSPDSTVARFELPRPLLPGDSVNVQFAWEARPSTVFRRQGRRGRTYDFAQWYPKVAVYDRGGWQPNPLVPAGELYGEFGDYDVTLLVQDDQILGSTGVPVSGDPGWARVSRTGPPRLGEMSYAAIPAGNIRVPTGYKAVRWVAKDVHHFAWTASTEYIYEGGEYVRPTSASRRFKTWDTVAVHVLMKPGDDSTWGRGTAVRRTVDALAWLEGIYGPYAYPQVTNVHRLDRGATEFPMMIMNSTASYGLILHELGHIYTYGILANNEWRSGWLDEGFTEYQTYWAQGLTPQEQMATTRIQIPGMLPSGYRVNAITITPPPGPDALGTLAQLQLELLGRSEPIGTHAAEFREFTIYNEMVYSRALDMYAHLRDLMGDSTYVRFLHEYYDRWALKHVDERAIRAAAARAYGQDLGWFFDQWVHDTGLLDYGINSVRSARSDDGRFVTNVDISRNGWYAHPMPVGIHTSRGWSIARARPDLDRQILQITTSEAPDSIMIDPFHVTMDWDRRNDVPGFPLAIVRHLRYGFDWPFLDQGDRDRTLLLLSPAVWTSGPQGAVIGVRARTNYLGNVDRFDNGFAISDKNPPPVPGRSVGAFNRLQLWWRVENPNLPWLTLSKPLMGYSLGVAHLDGITKIDASKVWDLSPFLYATGPSITARVGVDGAYPSQSPLLPEQWSNTHVSEANASLEVRATPRPDSVTAVVRFEGGVGYSAPRYLPGDRGYGRGVVSVTTSAPIVRNRRSVTMRLVAGWAPHAPLQRSVFASSRDPFATFGNNYFRSLDAMLKHRGINYRPLGGAGFRGYSPYVALDQVIAANAEGREKIIERDGDFGSATLYATVFADVGAVRIAPESPVGSTERLLSGGGLGLALRGQLYDRQFAVRVDLPIVLSAPGLGQGKASRDGSVALRWGFSLNDLW